MIIFPSLYYIVDGLFFTSPDGLELSSVSDEVTSLCSVPDIPDSNLSQESGSFCLVETDRGLFRSADIRITCKKQIMLCLCLMTE